MTIDIHQYALQWTLENLEPQNLKLRQQTEIFKSYSVKGKGEGKYKHGPKITADVNSNQYLLLKLYMNYLHSSLTIVGIRFQNQFLCPFTVKVT